MKINCEQIVRKFRSQFNFVIVIDSIDNRDMRNLYIVNSRDRDNKRVLDCDVVVIVINLEIENIFRMQNFFLEILRYFQYFAIFLTFCNRFLNKYDDSKSRLYIVTFVY